MVDVPVIESVGTDASTVSNTVIGMVIATIVFIVLRMYSKATKGVKVSELNIYPIKSCGPMKVRAAVVTDIGFMYDRFAQVSDSKGNFLTPREESNKKLFHVYPSIVYEKDGSIHFDLNSTTSNKGTFRIDNLNDTIEKSKTKSVTPMIGPKVKLQDLGDDVAKWLSDVTDIKDCRLTAIGPEYHRFVKKNPDQNEPVPFMDDEEKKDDDDGKPSVKKTTVTENKMYSVVIEDDDGNPVERKIPVVSLADEAPFLLTTTSSLNDLNKRLKARGKSKISMGRFRPNIVIQGTEPWIEDTWKRIRINGTEFHVWQRCGRCTMTTIDPNSLDRKGGEPLATLSTFRERTNGQRNFGMHLIPISNASMEYAETSLIQIGHKLEVLEYDTKRLLEWRRFFSSEADLMSGESKQKEEQKKVS